MKSITRYFKQQDDFHEESPAIGLCTGWRDLGGLACREDAGLMQASFLDVYGRQIDCYLVWIWILVKNN